MHEKALKKSRNVYFQVHNTNPGIEGQVEIKCIVKAMYNYNHRLRL